ncbi:hypothetical protein [Pontibacillus yanchengensis]|nr:hypothetical protein [Pontibacillus yanchengensis]
MVKQLVYLMCCIPLTLIGCTNANKSEEPPPVVEVEQNQDNEKNKDKADYQLLEIIKLKEASIVISSREIDSNASYAAYEIWVDEDTKIEGNRSTFEGLSVGDNVEVWVRDKGAEKEFASKIVVYAIES